MHQNFMREAIRLAQQKMLAGEGGPFGAIIVKENTIIARGWNRVTSLNDPTAHAEMVAIRNACQELHDFQLTGCHIYVNCEPCPMCLAALYWARVERIFFAADRNDAAAIGFDDQLIYQEMTVPVGKRFIQTEQTLRNEALAVFQLWHKLEKKVLY